METKATKRKETRSMFGHLFGTGAQCFMVSHQYPTSVIEQSKIYLCVCRYDFDCEQTDWQWAMCTACFLPVTFTTENSYVIARGLCSRTKFDTQFEVIIFHLAREIHYIKKDHRDHK